MKTEHDNPPAFPSNYEAIQGMSLRDYFAAKAMQALLHDWESSSQLDPGPDGIPARSYAIANAMIAARKEGA